MITVTSSEEVQDGSTAISVDTDKTKGFYNEFVDEKDVIAKIQEAISNADKPIRIGVILNTVRQAQEFYRNLGIASVPAKRMLIHSRFRVHDRLRLEQQVLDTIGKKAPDSNQHTIIVGTQVLEQSLDIDFDIMFTDLAPISLILQRAGRLHRHDRSDRPSNCQEPFVNVINGTEHQQKVHTMIYGEYQLESARRYLQEKPENEKVLYNDIPKILETIESYDDEEINKLRRIHKLDMKEQERKGMNFRVKDPKRVSHLFDFLSSDQADENENIGYARVRDIQSGPAILLFSRDENNEPIAGLKNTEESISVYNANMYSPQDIRTILSNSVVLSYRFIDYRLVQALEEQAYEQDDGILVNKFGINGNLAGEIPIILDSDESITLNDVTIRYSTEIGLTEEQGEQ